MNKTILVIELSLSGHRGEYVRWIVQSFLDVGHKVILMLPEESLLHESIAQLNHASLSIRGFKVDTKRIWKRIVCKLGLFGHDFLYYRVFRRLYRSIDDVHIDHVFIPFLDHILYTTAMIGSPFGNTSFSGISMRPDFHYEKMGVCVPYSRKYWIKELFFDQLLKVKTLVNVLTLDEALSIYYKTLKNDGHKLKFLPEPVALMRLDNEVKNRVMADLSLDNETRYILVYGFHTLRKGIEGLLKAAMNLGDIDCKIILAGKADSEIMALLSTPDCMKMLNSGKVVHVNHYISSEEESVLFSSAYLCWLGYIGHYRASGVLIQAAKYGVPIIATNEGIIGWQVQKHAIGERVNSQSVNDISNSIKRLFKDEAYYRECRKNTGKAFIDNTLENAARIVNESVG